MGRKDDENDDLSNESYYDYDFSKNRFYSPDLKKMVAKKTKNGFFKYRILDTETRKPIGQEITSKYRSRRTLIEPVLFSPDSKRLLTRYNKDSLQLWNGDSGSPIGEMIPLNIYGNVFFSPVERNIDGNNKKTSPMKMMTMQNKDTIMEFQLWNIEIGKKIGTNIVKSKTYTPLAQDDIIPPGTDPTVTFYTPGFYQFPPPRFSADGNWVFTFFSTKDSLYYELFDATTGKQKGIRHSLRLPDNEALSPYPVISPDGTSILAMINDSTLHLVDTESGNQKGDVIRYHPNWSPLYSPDGKWLLICTSERTAQFIDVETRDKRGNPIISLKSEPLPDRPLINWDRPLINWDGSRVLTIGNAGMVHLWNTLTQQQIKEGFKHISDNTLPKFSPDGKIFLTFDYYGTARLYDALTGEQIGPALKRPKSTIHDATFSRDGKKILITYSRDDEFDNPKLTGVIWNAVTGRQTGQEINDIFGQENFSEEGKWLLYSNYYSDQLLNTKAGDLDVPADLLELQVLMSSGYKYDFSIDEKSIITSKEFYGKDGISENYHNKAVSHYKVCKFSKYNLWRRFNEEEAKKIRPDDFIEENLKDSADSQFQILTAFNVSDTSRINNGSYLEPGQAIYSKNKEYLLAYLEDGNLVIYQKHGMEPIWESYTDGFPAYRTVMQYDGNLVIYADDPGKILGNSAIWSSDTWKNNADATLVLEDDGNLVIYNKKNKPVWDSKSGKKAKL